MLAVPGLGCGARAAASPAARVASAVEVGTLKASSLVVGRDVGATVMAWGHLVWLFGDTFLGVPNVDGSSFVSNTFATSPPSVTGTGIVLSERLDDAGAPGELLRPTALEQAYDRAHRASPDGRCAEAPCGGRYATWPSAAVFDPSGGGAALVFYAIVTAAPGAFNFQGIGQGVAVWNSFGGLATRPAPNRCDGGPPTALFCASEPGFGEGAVLVDGLVYTFGCTRKGMVFPCELGRVPFTAALDRTAWQFWNGQRWSADASTAATLFDGAPIMSFFFDAYLGRWTLVYSEPLSSQVAFRTAPALTGPWSPAEKLFMARYESPDGGAAYDAIVHPELAEQGGRVEYVTYSRPNGTPLGDELALVKVTFR
jgi:hypothetical protein